MIHTTNFFQSQPSLPSTSAAPHQSPARRFWNVMSRSRPPANESISLDRPKRGFFGRRARSNSLPESATVHTHPTTPEAKVRAGKEDERGVMDDDCSPMLSPGQQKV
ncbi:hypothetical protein DFH29DRAFT_1011167 [Suillus ampliporus]|nr:hypothetical protein DFH29DRAFT_1011167 [Suillus ampliporus]